MSAGRTADLSTNKEETVLAFVLMAGMLAAPFVLWIVGLNEFAVVVGIYVALYAHSIIRIVYLSVKNRTWPKIVGGPSFFWGGKQTNS